MNFKIGDKVICVTDGTWVTRISKDSKPGPKKDDILIVTGIDEEGDLGFAEYSIYFFDYRMFRKLSDIKSLQDYKLNTTILEDLSAPIKIGKGLPKPQELEKLQKL